MVYCNFLEDLFLLYILCLFWVFVYMFVSNKRQNGWTDRVHKKLEGQFRFSEFNEKMVTKSNI